MKKKNEEESIEMSLDEFDKFIEEMDNTPTCDKCINCIYLEQGDMYCDLTLDSVDESVRLVFEDFDPTIDYMWCDGKYYSKR